MTFVENGVRFTKEYGDIDGPFYASVESALDELATHLRGAGRELYAKFGDRLAKIEQEADGIGWGFHESIFEVGDQLEDELGEP